LIEMLPRVNDLAVREGIVRALTVKEARAAATPLLRQYYTVLERAEGETNGEAYFALRWAIASALRRLACREHAAEIMRLVADPRVGDYERQQLVRALARLRYREAIPMLIELLDDPGTQGQAIAALGTLEAVEARGFLLPFLTHPTAWIRKEAEKAIARIVRAK
jgi:HEAT repeat protein